jgi:Rrf2 family protein
MLSRTAAIALRALVELAREPARTLSVAELARRQQLPQPMLEQILLRLRRAGVVEARRGRHGGYRLAQQAETLPLARVLQAVGPPRKSPPAHVGTDPLARLDGPELRAGWDVPPAAHGPVAALAAQEPLQPGDPGDSPAPGPGTDHTASPASEEPGTSLGASAGHRVEQQLSRRLERLVQLELQRLTLAELLYDQRSWEASLGPDGGLMLS